MNARFVKKCEFVMIRLNTTETSTIRDNVRVDAELDSGM